MLTRHGVVAIAVGAVAATIGRVFGVIELFVIGAAFVVAPLCSMIIVRFRHPRIRASRWVHPSLLTAGEVGRVDIRLTYDGIVRSPSFNLSELIEQPIGPPHLVQLEIGSMAARATTTTRYSMPTATRGRLEIGPLMIETRDLLGLAVKRSAAAGLDEVVVVPRTHLVDMPRLGQGPLGRQLVDRARRLGPGEFHSLRDYVDGDEPRSIHWKASARSEELKVKQRTIEGLHRCTVVLDSSSTSYLDRDSFERAVTVTASLVHSAAHAGLTTRLVGAGGLDLRGPDVAATALRHLATAQYDETKMVPPERDPSEGLGLVLVVTGSREAKIWKSLDPLSNPMLTVVAVTTDQSSSGLLAVSARTEGEFLDRWQRLTGRSSRNAVDATRAPSPRLVGSPP